MSSGATTTIMLSQPMEMAPEGDGGAGLMNSMPITLQPVFIPRGGPNMMNSIGSRMPGSPPAGMGSSSASADWAFLLRSAAAMSQPSQGALGVAIDSLGHGSSSNAVHGDLAAAGMRSSPQFNSSPNLLYSPVSSAAPASGAFFNSMVELNANDMANSAATDPANSLVMHLSNGNNLASLSAAAAAQAVYGGDAGGVQTLYPSSSNDTLTIAANAARQAVQTQTLLQQQAAAVNSLSAGLGNMGLSPMAANGLGGTLEESLSGSLFAAAAAAAAANSAAASKPVSASLYIKNLPPDADKLFLYEKFSPFGAILSVKVLVDPQTGQCRGVGFVNFAEHASAMRSIQALHGTKVGDKSMHVSLQTPRIRASALHCP